MPPGEALKVYPHRAFVETIPLEEGTCEDELEVATEVDVDLGRWDACPEQVPNSGLQPALQCPVVRPHHPY